MDDDGAASKSPSSENEQQAGFDFPPEYAVLIANATSYWAALEANIDLAICHLAGVYPAVGACMTSQIFTLDGRMNALRSLLNLRRAPEALTKRINKFAEKVRLPQSIRNRITHDQWVQGIETKSMSQIAISARGSLNYGFKEIKLPELADDVQKIKHAMQAAADLRDSIEDALPSLPAIPMRDLQPIVRHGPLRTATRASDRTFTLFPPRPSAVE